uniref:Uncharacterized protein n=1 Tax=Mycena chlorophos TaxID=658473 RepID=A0ABQ0L0I9_MYCCL|nr:predicted protein [Mycena chlorophos]
MATRRDVMAGRAPRPPTPRETPPEDRAGFVPASVFNYPPTTQDDSPVQVPYPHLRGPAVPGRYSFGTARSPVSTEERGSDVHGYYPQPSIPPVSQDEQGSTDPDAGPGHWTSPRS